MLLALCTLWNGLDDQDAQELQRRAGEPLGQNGESSYTNEIWADRTESMASPVDIVGYNYMEDRYLSDHALFPDRVICGTESFPMAIGRVWELVEQCPYVIGDFTWTSADYIGEAGIGAAVYVDPSTPEEELADHNSRPYPWKLAYDADWDILNQPRPQLAYRKIVWGGTETYLAVRDPETYGKKELLSRWAWPQVWNSWTYPGFEGHPIQIDVYSPGDRVELFLNGKSLGAEPVERFTARFKTTYQPGLSARCAGGSELPERGGALPGPAGDRRGAGAPGPAARKHRSPGRWGVSAVCPGGVSGRPRPAGAGGTASPQRPGGGGCQPAELCLRQPPHR